MNVSDDATVITDPSFARRNGRTCVLIIYGVPVLLALVTVSIALLMPVVFGPGTAVVRPVFALINAGLAGLSAALAEVFRRGSLVRRVVGGFIFGVMGVALYTIALIAMITGYTLLSK